MLKRLALVAVMLALLGVLAVPAQAIPVPVELLDVGSCVTFGGGSMAYPLDATIKFIPVDFEGPIADPSFVKTLENVGRYALANTGADILIPISLNAEEVAGGLSLPVINGKMGVPLRSGIAYIGGIGYRGFLKIPWIASGAEPTALALLPIADRTDLLRLAESRLSLANLIPGEGSASFGVACTTGSVMAVYSTGL